MAIIAAAVALGVYVGLLFMGGQISAILKGTIEFGTSGTACSVDGDATTFETDQEVHYAAHLARVVKAGDVITATVTADPGGSETATMAFDDDADCVNGVIPSGSLTPGTWRLEYSIGEERLAEGTFAIVEP